MKKLLLSSLVFVAIIIILDYIAYLLTFHYGERQGIYIIDFLLKSVFIFLLIINILYNKAFNLKSKKAVIMIYIAFTLIISMVISDRLIAINKFYYYSKTLKKSTTGKIWRFDDSLSYTGRPNAVGAYNYYIGDSIEGSTPVIFDSLGFRTVPDSLVVKSDSTDLYLGCSFTFGDFVAAQNTYSYLTSKLLNHGYINGAISGYGAGQMVQIAERLIPKRKFSYVFIQLSSWTVTRAMEINGPTRFGYRPFPYYSETGKSSYRLNYPAYSTLMYSGKNWRKTGRTYLDKILFSFSDGLKIEIHDYYAYKLAEVKMKVGMIPVPTQNKVALEKWFFDYLIDYCAKNNATPVILKLKYPEKECKSLLEHLRNKVKIIDLDSAQREIITKTGLEYKQLFKIHHVTKHDSIIFDGHPNIYAHSMFSKTIFKEITHE